MLDPAFRPVSADPPDWHRELIDRLHRQQRARHAADAALVDRGDVLERVVVVGAVNLVVVAPRPHAVHRVAGDTRARAAASA